MLSFFMFDKVYMIKSQTYKNQKMHSNNIILFEYMSVCVCVYLDARDVHYLHLLKKFIKGAS